MLASAVVYGTPLLYAALGELLAERSGVLNLGVEGMMLTGAVMGFWAVQRTGVGCALAIARRRDRRRGDGAIHAFLVVTLRANQIVSGLALTIFAGAAGLSSYLGNDLQLARRAGASTRSRRSCRTAGRRRSVVGPILFKQSALVYASWVCVLLVALYLNRTRPGLNVRAVGESPAAADAMGINVARLPLRAHDRAAAPSRASAARCFTLSITPQWVDGITAGAGWIAIALVIFAFWRPAFCLVGAYLFGAFSGIPFTFQARGILGGIPPELFQALPYVMTIVVLVLVSSAGARRRLGAPRSARHAVRARRALADVPRPRPAGGKSRRIVVPASGLDSTTMPPPARRTIAKTVARPRPVPSSLVVKNGSNSRSCVSASMPMSVVRHGELDP